VHLHYFDEGNAYGNYVQYVISNVSLGYCITIKMCCADALVDEGIEKRN
jgi:hypothetical protein